jgi:PAS domain S-box-containing protein
MNKRQRMKAKVQDTKEILRKILDHIDAEIYVVDFETYEILFLNKPMRKSFGGDLNGEICWKVFRGEEKPCAHCTNGRLLDVDGNPSDAISWEGKNPITGKWYVNHDRAIEWEDGRIARVQVAIDISERILSEQALKHSEERYRIVSNLTSDFAYAFRVESENDLALEWVTDALVNITGYTADELNNQGGWESMIHPDDVLIPARQFHVVLSGKASIVNYRIITKAGDIRWVRDHACPNWDETQGKTTFIYGAIQDITNQVRSEKEIQRQMEAQLTLRMAGEAISSALDPEIVLAHIAKEMGKAIDATSAYINSYEEDEKLSAVIGKYIGPSANVKEKNSDLGEVYLDEGHIEFIEKMKSGLHDVSHNDDPNLTDYEKLEMLEYGVHSILYIPLRVKNELIGYLELWETRRRRKFLPEEIQLCQDMAQQTVIALDNARLYEVAQQEIADRKQAENKLQEAYASLEKRVEERTEELQILINSMVGREVRMAELKKVIKILRNQLIKIGVEPIADDPLTSFEVK